MKKNLHSIGFLIVGLMATSNLNAVISPEFVAAMKEGVLVKKEASMPTQPVVDKKMTTPSTEATFQKNSAPKNDKNANTKTITIIKTKKLLGLFAPFKPFFVFGTVIDGSIVNSPLITRIVGSTWIGEALLFPKGTVDTANQTDYTVDFNNIPLTPENSLGVVRGRGSAYKIIDLFNLPPAGTLLGHVNWYFEFKGEPGGADNRIFSNGQEVAADLITSFVDFSFTVDGAMGRNNKNKIWNTGIKVKTLLAPDGMSFLFKIKFDKKIAYVAP